LAYFWSFKAFFGVFNRLGQFRCENSNRQPTKTAVFRYKKRQVFFCIASYFVINPAIWRRISTNSFLITNNIFTLLNPKERNSEAIPRNRISSPGLNWNTIFWRFEEVQLTFWKPDRQLVISVHPEHFNRLSSPVHLSCSVEARVILAELLNPCRPKLKTCP